MNIPGSNGPVVVPLAAAPVYVAVGGGFELTADGAVAGRASFRRPGSPRWTCSWRFCLAGPTSTSTRPPSPAARCAATSSSAARPRAAAAATAWRSATLTGTSLRSIVFDAGNEAEIRNGAALVDTVTVEGLNTADDITAGVPNVLDNNYLVSGLPYNILVTGSDGAVASGRTAISSSLNGNGGNDDADGAGAAGDRHARHAQRQRRRRLLSADATSTAATATTPWTAPATTRCGRTIFVGNGGTDSVTGGQRTATPSWSRAPPARTSSSDV